MPIRKTLNKTQSGHLFCIPKTARAIRM